MGNSTERIQLKDLNDVVYYKQIKEYTDAEFETSKDLKREINAGRIVQLERTEPPRVSEDTVPHGDSPSNSGSSVSLNDIRALLKEVLPSSNGEDIKTAVKEIAPLIADMVRQELAKLPTQQVYMGGMGVVRSPESVKIESAFKDLTYVPEVDTSKMVSKVEAKKTAVSGDSANDALAALRRLNKIPNRS